MSQNEIDRISFDKVKYLFVSGKITEIETGRVRGLQDIHLALFGGLYPLAGQWQSYPYMARHDVKTFFG